MWSRGFTASVQPEIIALKQGCFFQRRRAGGPGAGNSTSQGLPECGLCGRLWVQPPESRLNFQNPGDLLCLWFGEAFPQPCDDETNNVKE